MDRFALATLLAALCAALFISAGCGSAEEGPKLLVINLNILHGIGDEDPDAPDNDRFAERIEIIADALAAEQPEIITLQEVLTAGDDYPDVRGILLEALGPEYVSIFGNLLGDPIDTPGIGQLTITRLPVVSSENRHVGGPRAVHRVTVETNDGLIDIYNAHLDGTNFDDPQAAVTEIAVVMDFIDDTRSGGPVILAGDFNAVPDDLSMKALRDAGYIDVLDKAGDASCEEAGDAGCTSDNVPLADPERKADHRIDFMFVLGGEDLRFEPDDAKLFLGEAVDLGGGEWLWASDHIGVWGLLELKSK